MIAPNLLIHAASSSASERQHAVDAPTLGPAVIAYADGGQQIRKGTPVLSTAEN